jgi:DNA modification methylase
LKKVVLHSGRAVLLCGDSAKLLKAVKDNYVDLTVTSPPYDDLRQYEGFTFDFETIAKELYRVTKVGGIVVWVVADKTHNGSESGTSFSQALYFKTIGFNLHDTMIYAKETYVPLTHNRFEQQFEYMFIFSKNKPKTFNPLVVPCIHAGRVPMGTVQKTSNGDRSTKNTIKPVADYKIKGNVWFYNVGKNQATRDQIAYLHPATFPEKLAEDHILSWSNPNDVVLDPMMGSGTTGKMALLNNRKFIGIECSEYYFDDIAVPRLEHTFAVTQDATA